MNRTNLTNLRMKKKMMKKKKKKIFPNFPVSSFDHTLYRVEREREREMNRNLMSFDDDDDDDGSKSNGGIFKLRKKKKKKKKKKKNFRASDDVDDVDKEEIEQSSRRRRGKTKKGKRVVKSFQTFDDEEEDEEEDEETNTTTPGAAEPMDVDEEDIIIDSKFQGDYLVQQQQQQSNQDDGPLIVPTIQTNMDVITTETTDNTPTSLSHVLSRLRRAQTDASKSSRTTHIRLAEAKKSLERSKSRVEELSMEISKQKPRFEYLQRFRSFVRGLCGLLREIAPKIAGLREQAILSTKSTLSLSFRPKDVSLNAWFQEPNENTLKNLILTPPPAIVPRTTKHHPQVATLLEDAREDLQSLDSISAKCLELHQAYPEDYANSFVGISIPKLFAVYIEMILLSDSNLFLHHENINALQPVLETLSPWRNIDSDDEETQRIGSVYQRTVKIFISNLLSDSIRYYYDAASFNQTDCAIRIFKSMLLPMKNVKLDSLEDTIVESLERVTNRVTTGSLVQALNVRRGLNNTDTADSDRTLSVLYARLLKILISSNRWAQIIPSLKERLQSVRVKIVNSSVSVLNDVFWSNRSILDINDKDEFMSHVVSRERWLRLVVLLSCHGDREAADSLRPLLKRARSELSSFDKENGEIRSLSTYRRLLLSVP